MQHVTVDEIIAFVSFDRFDPETIALSKKVNGHIKNCDECLRKVRAFQVIYDELVSKGRREDFKRAAHQAAKSASAVQDTEPEVTK